MFARLRLKLRTLTLWGLVLPLVALVLALAVLCTTTLGLRLLADSATTLALGFGVQLRFHGVEGRLLGPLRIDRVDVRTAGGGVEIDALDVDWAPGELLRGTLRVHALTAARLRIIPGAKSEPAPPPLRIALPLALQVERLQLDRLVLAGGEPQQGGLDRGQGNAPGGGQGSSQGSGPERDAGGGAGRGAGDDRALVEALVGRIDSDGRVHRWQLAAQALGGRLAAESAGQLDGVPAGPQRAAGPHLDATAQITARQGEQQLVLELAAAGPLTRLPLQLALSAERPEQGSATGEAVITPFAPVPLASLHLQLAGVDPAFWVPAAGQARLTADIRLAPAGGGFAGPIVIDNALPGRLDAGRWPLRRLAADLAWQPGVLAIDRLAAELSAGRVQGRLRVDLPQGGDARQPPGTSAAPPAALQTRGRLTLTDVDPAQIHGALRPARLRGDLELSASAERQRLEGQLSESRFSLRFAASHADGQAVVEHALLAGAFGRARLNGEIELAGARRFRVAGELDHVQPHRFVELPEMDLVGTVHAEGALQPAWQVRVETDLAGSRIEDKLVALQGRFSLDAARHLDADLLLTQAANRLSVQGALGRPGDRLQAQLDAPDFALPGIALRGRGTLVFEGSLPLPAARADLAIDQLTFAGGGGVQLAGLRLQGELPAGMDGPLALQATLDRLAGQEKTLEKAPGNGQGGGQGNGQGSGPGNGQEKPWLQHAKVSLQGSRQDHRLQVEGDYLDGGRLAAEFAGHFETAADAGWRWRAQVLRTDITAPARVPLGPFRLAAPAALRVDAASAQLADFRMESARGQVQLDTLAWRADVGLARIDATADAFPVAPFLPAAFAASDLELGGRWLYDHEAAERNRLTVERRRGDLRLDAPQALALGIDTLSLSADLTRRGRVALDARIAGTRLGSAQASLALLRDGNDLMVDRSAPWQGLADWQLPDITFLGPLIYPGARTAGMFGGVVEVAGTPDDPRFTGRIAGQQVRVVLLESGMQLVDGDIQLRLEQEQLGIEVFRFRDGSALAPPRDELTGRPGGDAGGGVAVAGAVDLAARTGALTIDIDRLGLVQRRDVWLRATGQARLDLSSRRIDLRGRARVDGAAFHLGRDFGSRRPTLSDDVVIVGQAPKSRGSLPLYINFGIDLGDACYLRMKEVESRLAGELRIVSQPGNPARASGSVRTEGGRFVAYGQDLAIERGILNFQGPIDNPGLNILAMRRDQEVAAGVEVTGTALRPRLRLVSEPEVSDTDKLSWLILGRGTEQLGGNDSGFLAAAAKALFAEVGSDEDGTLQRIQRRLGLSVSIREGQVGGPSQAPASAIVGARGGAPVGGSTVVGLSTRLAKGVSFSLEQAVGIGEQLATISIELTRRLSVVLSAGVDHAFDLRYGFDFGKRERPDAAAGMPPPGNDAATGAPTAGAPALPPAAPAAPASKP